jgi:hypothetical protein
LLYPLLLHRSHELLLVRLARSRRLGPASAPRLPLLLLLHRRQLLELANDGLWVPSTTDQLCQHHLLLRVAAIGEAKLLDSSANHFALAVDALR